MTEQPTCLKNYANPSCIYLYLKNCTKRFQSTLTLETGLSDFHKLPLKLNMKKFHLILYKIETIKNFDSSKLFEKLQLKLSNLT